MEKIVVGKPSTPTPTFSANMQFVIFNPEWGVPDGIKVNEIAPRLRQVRVVEAAFSSSEAAAAAVFFNAWEAFA